MNTASLSPPSPEEQDTPRPNFTMPPSKSVTSMGTDSVDSPLLGVLGVVELELAPDELPLDELEPQPEPEPEPEDDSSSPDPDPDPKRDSPPEPEELSSSPDPELPPKDGPSSPESEGNLLSSEPELDSLSPPLLSSSLLSSEESLSSLE
ncbi:hypothetical protein N0V87_004176 [Didymella glomerata]|uniref:Uncharacterized protein n=1 Tax=Didymella glomerata TaxID=749621 RepID=A0A9W8X158_9PLEO|nr:hypothetical protein N0V87_004176 [Didymella glomerata]